MSWELLNSLPSGLRSGNSGLDGLRSLLAVKLSFAFLSGDACSSLCLCYEFQKFAGLRSLIREKIIALSKSLGGFLILLAFLIIVTSGFSVPESGGYGLGVNSMGAEEGH